MEQTSKPSHKRGRAAENGSGIEFSDAIPDAINDQIEEVSERFGEMTERLASLIRERPIRSLLVASVGGYLIGRLLR